MFHHVSKSVLFQSIAPLGGLLPMTKTSYYNIYFLKIMSDIEKDAKKPNLSAKALDGGKKTIQKIGGFLESFKEFINRGNVVDLAVGIVMGTSFTFIVNSFVVDLISPFIALSMPGKSLNNQFLILQCPKDNKTDVVTACSAKQFTTVEAANAAGVISLNYGSFIQVYII